MRFAFAVLLAAAAACTSSGTTLPAELPDAAVQAAVDPCDACTATELCVQLFDGVCDLQTSCVPRDPTCADPSLTDQACSAACNTAYCAREYACTDRMGCDGPAPSPKAFTCYGP